MPRVKGGYTTRRRRKAVLKLAKGYVGSKHTIYRTANEAVMRAMQYAYRDRKQRNVISVSFGFNVLMLQLRKMD